MMVLLIATLFPLAGRQLVLLAVHASRVYINEEGSLSRSVRRTFGRSFLAQLNCQSLEPERKHLGLKTSVEASQPSVPVLFFSGITAPSAPNLFEQKFFSSAGFTPLRI
jgi:hypothetical protein